MANRKTKSVAVTTVPGVTGIFDELYAREREGVGTRGEAIARASRTINCSGDSGDTLSNSLNEVLFKGESGVTTTPKTGGDTGGDTGDSQSAAAAEPSLSLVRNAESLGLPLSMWADLPRPSSIRIVTHTGRTAWLTASRRRLQDAAAAREAAFGPNEYEAALGAILARRATAADLDGWIARKLTAPDWRLQAIAAMAGAIGLLDARGRVKAELLDVSVGRALEVARCEALEVVVEDTTPIAAAAEPTAQELASL